MKLDLINLVFTVIEILLIEQYQYQCANQNMLDIGR